MVPIVRPVLLGNFAQGKQRFDNEPSFCFCGVLIKFFYPLSHPLFLPPKTDTTLMLRFVMDAPLGLHNLQKGNRLVCRVSQENINPSRIQRNVWIVHWVNTQTKSNRNNVWTVLVVRKQHRMELQSVLIVWLVHMVSTMVNHAKIVLLDNIVLAMMKTHFIVTNARKDLNKPSRVKPYAFRVLRENFE